MDKSDLKWVPTKVNYVFPFDDVTTYFLAACALDKDTVADVVNSGRLDVNTQTIFGQDHKPGRPDGHMLQSFGSVQRGKVTCQIFEKIDQEEKIEDIFALLQV